MFTLYEVINAEIFRHQRQNLEIKVGGSGCRCNPIDWSTNRTPCVPLSWPPTSFIHNPRVLIADRCIDLAIDWSGRAASFGYLKASSHKAASSTV